MVAHFDSSLINALLHEQAGALPVISKMLISVREIAEKVVRSLDHQKKGPSQQRVDSFLRGLLQSTLLDINRTINPGLSINQHIELVLANGEKVPEGLPMIISRVARDIILTSLLATDSLRSKLPQLDNQDLHALFLCAKFRALELLCDGRSLRELPRIIKFLNRPTKTIPIQECRPLHAGRRWQPLFHGAEDLGNFYKVEALETIDKLQEEGRILEHCLNSDPSYASLCLQGKIQILSFTYRGQKVATLTVSRVEGPEGKELESMGDSEFVVRNDHGSRFTWRLERKTFKKKTDVPVNDSSESDEGLVKAYRTFLARARKGEINFNAALFSEPGVVERMHRVNVDPSPFYPFELFVGVPINEPDKVARFFAHYEHLNGEYPRYCKGQDAEKGRKATHHPQVGSKPLFNLDQLRDVSWAEKFFEARDDSAKSFSTKKDLSTRDIYPYPVRGNAEPKAESLPSQGAKSEVIQREVAVVAPVLVDGMIIECILSDGSIGKSFDEQREYARKHGCRLATREENFAFLNNLLDREAEKVMSEADKKALRSYEDLQVWDDEGSVYLDEGYVTSHYGYSIGEFPEPVLMARLPKESRAKALGRYREMLASMFNIQGRRSFFRRRS
jgi:hypothetical protein